LSLRIEARQEEELRERRFDAAMTAYLMNISGRSVRTPVSADWLLGIGQGKQSKKKNVKQSVRPTKTIAQLKAEAKERGNTYVDYQRDHAS
jgi:hypothetical protein